MTPADRLAAADWARAAAEIDAQGWAMIGPILDPEDCATLAALYDQPTGFRATVTMARHGFGQGEYKYFAYPLPEPVAALRAAAYPPLARIADAWAARTGAPERLPATHAEYLARCHAAGQTRPTPLLLRYGPGDHNRLHQDLYGPLVFPLQLVILLDRPGVDFTGGELALVEQRPRQQSRVEIVPLAQGCAAVFPVNRRPVPRSSPRGHFQAAMRHGVATVRSGRRRTLGIILHDAA